MGGETRYGYLGLHNHECQCHSVVAYFLSLVMEMDKLLFEVESRPCLWNRGNEDFNNKNIKEACWREVCSNIIPDWNELGDAKQSKSVLYMKAKWKSIMHKYAKSSEEGRSGNPAPKKIKLSYMRPQNLDFLRVCIEKCPTSVNVTESTRQISEQVASASTPSGCNSSQLLPPEMPGLRTGNKKRFPLNSFQSSLLTTLERACQQVQVFEDPDRSYLLSLLPSFKRLSERNKWRFRQRVLDFFVSTDDNQTENAHHISGSLENSTLQQSSHSSYHMPPETFCHPTYASPSDILYNSSIKPLHSPPHYLFQSYTQSKDSDTE